MDFLQNRKNGQMWAKEREWLYRTCLELAPRVAIETGTWLGGGSTFYIASALRDAGGGLLYTTENNAECFGQAIMSYQEQWPDLLPFVRFQLGDSLLTLPPILESVGPIDFVFLDSGDPATFKTQDAGLMLQEFELLAPHLRVGGVLMIHDWLFGKADALKPRLIGNMNWQIEVMGLTGGGFESGSMVGMAKATKLMPS